MKRKLFIPVILICLISAGCLGQQQVDNRIAQPKEGVFVEKAVDFQQIKAVGGQGEPATPTYKVYLNDPGLANGIDFTRYFLLVASRGQKGSPGYQIKIGAVKQTAPAQFKVIVELSDPVPGQFYAAVITHPQDMVLVKRVYLPKSGTVQFDFVDNSGAVLGRDTVNLS